MVEPFKCKTDGYKYKGEECTQYNKDKGVCKQERSCFFKIHPNNPKQIKDKSWVELMVDLYSVDYWKYLKP